MNVVQRCCKRLPRKFQDKPELHLFTVQRSISHLDRNNYRFWLILACAKVLNRQYCQVLSGQTGMDNNSCFERRWIHLLSHNGKKWGFACLILRPLVIKGAFLWGDVVK